MKVAALYSGFPRTYKYCLPNHKITFWKKYNISDCYFHFWNPEQMEKDSSPWSEGSIFPIKSTKEDIIESFSPIKFLIEDNPFNTVNNKLKYNYQFDKFSKKDILNHCLTSIKSNLLSVKNVIGLVEDTYYDYYVLCRPDMLWEENSDKWPELNGINNYFYWDTFWIFKKNMLKLYGNRYYKVDEYFDLLINSDNNTDAKNYHFITHEAINDLYFKSFHIDLGTFIPILMKKQIHRGNFIQN